MKQTRPTLNERNVTYGRDPDSGVVGLTCNCSVLHSAELWACKEMFKVGDVRWTTGSEVRDLFNSSYSVAIWSTSWPTSLLTRRSHAWHTMDLP